MDHAIKHAVLEIKLKDEKHHKSKDKRNKRSRKYELIDENELGDELDTELDEGQQSPILQSPIVDRKRERREAISEKNITERALVKSTLKHYMQSLHAARYALK